MTEFVDPIPYDRSALAPGIAHFGVGNFHRAHQAMYIDQLLRNPDTFEQARSWALMGIGVLPGDALMRDALASQDFEYTLVERHPDGSTPATRIGSIIGMLHAPEQLDDVLAFLATPSTRIVSLTITEGGYNISDSTGSFDTENPVVVADAAPGARPATVFGIITAALQLRRERGIAPFTVMSCDNIEDNGDIAKSSFIAYARLIDDDLAAWISSNVTFPNSMVDRITPVTTDADRGWVRTHFGVDDAWPVLSEDYVQWVLEDDFPTGRPAYDSVGVQLVDDVRPYELMKLRLLNASHQALAYSGLLFGYEYAHEATADPLIAWYLRAYMDDEATPTLEPVPGIDLEAYKDKLIERFANPHVKDTLARLATDASDRIPKWLVPVARERSHSGATSPLSASVIAGWARYAERVFAGDSLPFRDRQEPAVRAAVARMDELPDAFLRNPDWFGDLSEDETFGRDFVTAYAAFSGLNPRVAIEHLAEGAKDRSSNL